MLLSDREKHVPLPVGDPEQDGPTFSAIGFGNSFSWIRDFLPVYFDDYLSGSESITGGLGVGIDIKNGNSRFAVIESETVTGFVVEFPEADSLESTFLNGMGSLTG